MILIALYVYGNSCLCRYNNTNDNRPNNNKCIYTWGESEAASESISEVNLH